MDYFGRHEAHQLAVDLMQNADDLLCEAELLLGQDHQARALFLATIAAEEIGKIQLCFAVMSGQEVVPDSWKREWTNHREKLSSMNALEAAFLRDDVVADLQSWLARDEVSPWAQAKMAALYVDLEANGRVLRPRETTSSDAAEAIRRGREASSLVHTVLDPVTPEILDAMQTELKAIDAVIGGLIDKEDREGSIRLLRETLAASISGDAEQLNCVLNVALARQRAKDEAAPESDGAPRPMTEGLPNHRTRSL